MKTINFTYRSTEVSCIRVAGILCSTSSCESIKCGGGLRGDFGSRSRIIVDIIGALSRECVDDGLADPDDNASLCSGLSSSSRCCCSSPPSSVKKK